MTGTGGANHCPRVSTPPRIDVEGLRSALLSFYDRDSRDLPWRRERDPYRIWVSEIMLQQTRVETAEPYYRRWMDRFPTLEDLAGASRDEVLKAWEGLGYYSRARRLHDSARMVRERLGGEIPSSAEALRELPGVGEYTAGAVASIAFGEVTPAIDGNARRVLARLFDLADPGLAEVRAIVEELIDPGRPGDFNQAVMELGATICTPRAPRCGVCPLGSVCRAMAAGTQLVRPVAKSRGKTPLREFGVAVVLDPESRFLLRQRTEEGLLGGLWEFPSALMERGEASLRAARRAAADAGVSRAEPSSGGASGALDPVRHAFSHFRAVYHAQVLRIDAAQAPGVCRWSTLAEVSGLAMPVAQRKILGNWRSTLGEKILA
ncbi:MAG: A/G-specific adenine glycosylase [Gemmatimonadota bacterium]|nr:MAG: A/G-specific adenine glycosylase [Gemmatimonadota bacterium]